MNLPTRRLPLLSIAMLSIVWSAGPASYAFAQAVPTASKTIGLAAFGAVARVSPDYGASQNYGFMLGGDVSRHLRLFDPSIEVRYTHAGGSVVGESSITGGLKAEKVYRNFHPYADFMIGQGRISFTHPAPFATGPFVHDTSLIFVLGGGVDYDLSSRFALKGDFQYQSWKLSTAKNRLTPSILSLGVVYRIPFKDLRGRR